MKKTILAIVFILCVIPLWAGLSQGVFGIEVAGGYSMTALTNFNKNFENVFNYGYLSDFSGTAIANQVAANPISGLVLADVKFRYSVTNGLPIYLRLGFMRLEATEILHDTNTDKDIAESFAALNVAYAGLGLKYGFNISSGFALFIGADAGCFIPVNSYWEVLGYPTSPLVNTNNADPSYNYYSSVDFNKLFFGGNAGAGIEWAISRSWGIILEGGYKIAKTAVAYDKNGIFNRAAFDFKEMDFSGPYATGGLVVYFGGQDKPEAAGQPGSDRNGDQYFRQKNYKMALNSYSAEYKQAPSAALYKKIGLCYYYLGMKDKAVFIFERYLKMNPKDNAVRGWLQNLKK